MEIATNRNQAERLIAAGVSADSADMMWREDLTGLRLEVCPHWVEEFRNLHYSPAWSLGTLMSIIPSIINHPDLATVNPDDPVSRVVMRDYQWKWWRNEAWKIPAVDGDDEEMIWPAKFGMMYTAFAVLPANHPIMPCAPTEAYLYDDEGDKLMWGDENPCEVCVQAIEWLVKKGHKLNQLNG